MKVLVIHPYRESRHKMWKNHFFMPERAVSVATYLKDQGHDVDFVDYSQTTLDDDHVFSVPTPRELKGTGWNFHRYGWSDEEIVEDLNQRVDKYDAYIVDSLTPYFRSGVEFIVDYLDSEVGASNVAMFGEWVGLRPEDFQSHVAVKGNWEAGLHSVLESKPGSPGVYTFGYDEVGMDDLPPPRWKEFVDMEDYPEPHCADYRASRGCPEKCNFCHVAGIYDGVIQGKSAERITEDIQYFVDEGFTKLKLRDDNFCVRGKVALEVFEWIADNHPKLEILQPEGMEMKTAAHVPEVINAMGRCNYDRVAVGFETIVDGEFQKNSLDWWEKAHENFKNAGFGPGSITCFVMRGHPHLERSDEIDTAIYLSNYDVSLLSGGYRLVPGTQLWEEWKTDKPYIYGMGLPQLSEKDGIQKVGQLFSTVSAWNEWGLNLFAPDALDQFRDVSWVDSITDNGDEISIEGTVSGWQRTDGIERGFAILLAMRGYHKHDLVDNTKRKMTVKGLKGNNPFMKLVMDRAEEQGVEVKKPGGLL